MAKKMLIDATHAEETRVVVVDGNKVEEFDFETVNTRQLAGNIYLAKVTRVEPSLQAAFGLPAFPCPAFARCIAVLSRTPCGVQLWPPPVRTTGRMCGLSAIRPALPAARTRWASTWDDSKSDRSGGSVNGRVRRIPTLAGKTGQTQWLFPPQRGGTAAARPNCKRWLGQTRHSLIIWPEETRAGSATQPREGIMADVSRPLIALLVSTILAFGSGAGHADDDDDDENDEVAGDFAYGAPGDPSEAWLLAAGGRIYDNWWEALDREEPKGTHPAYPAAGQQSGASTWRCKECHGWDYRGADGIYSKGSHFTGIRGITGAAGRPEADIVALLRGPLHGYTPEMIGDDEMARVAAFVSRGQVDMAAYIDRDTREMKAGDADVGRNVFQTVCAACHGFDGRQLDWGDGDEHAYVGTEARAAPDEVLHKILNAHPGVNMVNLRAFPLQTAVDVLRYATTLPAE